MTIKKRPSAPGAPVAASAGSAAPSRAAISDRFKLETLGTGAEKPAVVGRTPALVALIAGLLALTVSGLLTFILWKHWEFLMPA